VAEIGEEKKWLEQELGGMVWIAGNWRI